MDQMLLQNTNILSQPYHTGFQRMRELIKVEVWAVLGLPQVAVLLVVGSDVAGAHVVHVVHRVAVHVATETGHFPVVLVVSIQENVDTGTWWNACSKCNAMIGVLGHDSAL